MKNQILDEVAQRKMAVKVLLESKGYAILLSEIDNFTQYASAAVQASQEDGFITADKLSKLNFELGRKAGLQMVLNVFQQFQEELEA